MSALYVMEKYKWSAFTEWMPTYKVLGIKKEGKWKYENACTTL